MVLTGRRCILGPSLGVSIDRMGPRRGPWLPAPRGLHLRLHHGHVLVVLHILGLHGHDLPLHLRTEGCA